MIAITPKFGPSAGSVSKGDEPPLSACPSILARLPEAVSASILDNLEVRDFKTLGYASRTYRRFTESCFPLYAARLFLKFQATIATVYPQDLEDIIESCRTKKHAEVDLMSRPFSVPSGVRSSKLFTLIPWLAVEMEKDKADEEVQGMIERCRPLEDLLIQTQKDYFKSNRRPILFELAGKCRQLALPLTSKIIDQMPLEERIKFELDYIFKSRRPPGIDEAPSTELQDPANLDPAHIVKLLSDRLLPHCQFKRQGYLQPRALPGLEFLGSHIEDTVLSITLGNQFYDDLDLLVRARLGRHLVRESNPSYQKTFDPKAGIVIPGEEDLAASILRASPFKVYVTFEWDRLTETPAVLIIQFKRFSRKDSPVILIDSRPAILPIDGILDLTRYCDLKPARKSVQYFIKCMVIHRGPSSDSLRDYVYLSCIDGKYYQTDSSGVAKISREEFFGHQDAYLLILERIPD